ncbi:MAG: cyclic lactone autoinducer peptide [Lachnospiraceae bacterium]|nr:cyclic lactone autoinducer peptide [Lachnospiraceae bacterium]
MTLALSFLAKLSYFSAKFSANSNCGIIFYEPEMPERVKKLIEY